MAGDNGRARGAYFGGVPTGFREELSEYRTMPADGTEHVLVPREPGTKHALDGTAKATKRLRIALLGQFGVGNFGNDGSLEAMISSLRRICPDAELCVICTEPEVVAGSFGIKTIKLTRPGIKAPSLDRLNRLFGRLPYKLLGPIRAFRLLRGFDAVVLPGTGAFDDFGDTPFGMPYVFLKWMLMARLRGSTVAFVSIGAGPAYHRLSRHFFSGASRCATYRSFRDGISRDFTTTLGVDTSADRVFPDLAFSLPVPRPAERKLDAPVIIGLGVMNYRGRTGEGTQIYDRYIAKLADFTKYALSRGFAVRLMLGQDNDVVAVDDLVDRLRTSVTDEELARIIYEPSNSLHDVMAQMQATDVIVATRFHNVVCALRVGMPLISLGYLEKHDALAKEMGLADFCGDVEQFSVAWLISSLERLLDEKDARAARVQETVQRYARQLAAQETLLRKQIFDPLRR